MGYRFRGGGHFSAAQTRSGKSFVHAGRRVVVKGKNFQLTWNGPVLEQVIQEALVAAFEQLSDDALDYMRSITPYKTGFLHDSNVVRVIVNNGRLAIEIGNTAFYAVYVELGTIRNGAQPFMRPTFDFVKQQLPKIIRDEVSKRANTYAS